MCIANFAAIPHGDYRVGLPSGGTWTEVLNTDADAYAGSGVGNLGSVTATDEGWNSQPASATVTLPPLGTIWLRPALSLRLLTLGRERHREHAGR